jgi:hypothetical protein
MLATARPSNVAVNADRSPRRGAVLPLVAFCLVGLVGVLALAIDVGMIAVARSQCQNAADAAAMAGVRTINGDSLSNYNYAAVPGKAIQAATSNRIFAKNFQGSKDSVAALNGHTFQSGEVTIEIGTYAYQYDDANPNNESFKAEFPRTDANEPYSAVRATVQHLMDRKNGEVFFSSIFGASTFTTNASALAVHRPRDVVIIVDLSGSMRFQSLPGIYVDGGVASPSASNRPRNLSMNPEAIFPQFGHYSDVATAALRGTSSSSTGTEMVDPANISTTTNSGPPIAEDFYANAAGVPPGPSNRAFKRSSDAYDMTPGGNNYLRTQNNSAGNPYAKTVNEITAANALKEVDFENRGYEAYVKNFKGYVEGPGYWGKTFFIWPPDPRGSTLDPNDVKNHADNGAKDWRQRFFFKYNTSTAKLGWLDHTILLYDPAGQPATAAVTAPGTAIIRRPDQDTVVSENGVNVTYRYKINYAAILHWLQDNPSHFPSELRAGRIKYYDTLPNPKDTTLNNRWWTTYPLPDLNERFWKQYIDFVLGLAVDSAGAYQERNYDPSGIYLANVPLSALIGNGDYFAWGTVKVGQKPDVSPHVIGKINNSAGYKAGEGYSNTIAVLNPNDPDVAVGQWVRFANHSSLYRVTQVTNNNGAITGIRIDNGQNKGLDAAVAHSEGVNCYSTMPRYIDYDGNPHRPRHQLWFGPMTFIDYLGNYNTGRFWWPGNCHEAQCWACKVGVQTAIEDIKKNHPNDFIGMAYFSSPSYAANNAGQHNHARVPLGRNYQQLIDSLWFPMTTITGSATEITPYDADFVQVPRAKGATCPGMGFMIAYNLLSSSSTNLRFYSEPQPLNRGTAGGLGRKGAQRVIIFETDGAPNIRAAASMGGSGKDSYYKIRLKKPADYTDGNNVEWPAGGAYAHQDVYDVVDQICKLDTANPPGYSTARRPALIYSIGYGSLFDPNNPSAGQTDALDFLQTVAYKGNTAKSTSGGSFPDNRRIYGTNQQRIDRISNIFTEIMQSGVQVSLIE